MGFSNTGWSINPHSSNSSMFVLWAHIEFEQIYTLLDLFVSFDWYDASVDGCCHICGYLLVASSYVSLNIASSGLDSECEWSFKSSFLLVAIVAGSIIFFNKLKVRF